MFEKYFLQNVRRRLRLHFPLALLLGVQDAMLENSILYFMKNALTDSRYFQLHR